MPQDVLLAGSAAVTVDAAQVATSNVMAQRIGLLLVDLSDLNDRRCRDRSFGRQSLPNGRDPTDCGSRGSKPSVTGDTLAKLQEHKAERRVNGLTDNRERGIDGCLHGEQG